MADPATDDLIHTAERFCAGEFVDHAELKLAVRQLLNENVKLRKLLKTTGLYTPRETYAP